MTCETECNALKSEQTDNLTVNYKYQISKITVADQQYFTTIQVSCSSILEIVRWLSCVYINCQMGEICTVIFSMSHAFNALFRCLYKENKTCVENLAWQRGFRWGSGTSGDGELLLGTPRTQYWLCTQHCFCIYWPYVLTE